MPDERIKEQGILYLVPTPIGNLEDMTFRAIRILAEVDAIAAEDTRNSIKLCNHFDITTPLIPLHEHNEFDKSDELIKRLENGEDIAIISDAGMPCISDPGVIVVQKAINAGIKVTPLPGANAALTGLIASGLSPQPFYFFGFLDRGKKEREEQLLRVLTYPETLIFYESPHRIKETVQSISDLTGGKRKIVLARELTKKYEQFIRGTAQDILEWLHHHEIRGEFVVLIEGSDGSEVEQPQVWWESLTIVEHVDQLVQMKKLKPKAAMREVAVERNMSRRDIYAIYHEI